MNKRQQLQILPFCKRFIMLKIIVLCTIVCSVAAHKATFYGYKVFRIIPTMEEQIKLLLQLEEVHDGFSYWKEPSVIDEIVDLMVAPHKFPEFYEMMKQFGISYEVFIENVQSLIDQRKRRSFVNESISFDFKNYHTLEEIYKKLDHLTEQHPGTVYSVIGGYTHESRDIKGVKVSFNNRRNPGIFIEGGIHAREWISPATVMYILHQLLFSHDPDIRNLAESHNWYIFPVFNPDGYVYTHTTDRLWKKTRKPTEMDYLCIGTDANRNWDFMWESEDYSAYPCSPTFSGVMPFSETETKTMSQYIKSISNKFYAYISFHSYSQRLMYPYGYTTENLENHEDLYAIGLKAAAALKQKHGTDFLVRNSGAIFYSHTGSSADYIKGVHYKPIVYTYVLRDQGHYGFLLPPEQIIPSGEETMDSLVAMFKEAKARGYPKTI